MALDMNPQEIYNSLRIPDAIKDMQTFNGNPKHLGDFINNVEEILLLIKNTEDTPYGKLLLRAIRNKIVGETNEALNIHLTNNSWNAIRDTLTDLYGDKREESTIIGELYNTKQYNNSVEDFYKQITEIQTRLFNNMRLKETDTTILKTKKKLYESIALEVFLTGLKEPLGRTIRAMRPENLPNALDFCRREQTIISNRPYGNYNFFYPRRFSTNNRIDSYQFQRYRNPIYTNRSPYQYPRMINSQQLPPFSDNPFNNTPENNSFNKHQQQIKNSNSGISRQNTSTQRNNFNQQQSTQSRFGRQLKMEEINNIDCHEEVEVGTNIENGIQNFRVTASIDGTNT